MIRWSIDSFPIAAGWSADFSRLLHFGERRSQRHYRGRLKAALHFVVISHGLVE